MCRVLKRSRTLTSSAREYLAALARIRRCSRAWALERYSVLANLESQTRPGRKIATRSAGISASRNASASANKRRIDRLVGQLKGAVVMTERARGVAIDKRLHRLGRIHVLVGHEPARDGPPHTL
jgi:hypothetical protein